jgi:hypothetical protein
MAAARGSADVGVPPVDGEETLGLGDLPAGDLSAWLAGIRGALHDGLGADVPCGGCTACCSASQFVHIGPDETDTLAHVPPALLFAAPNLPPGHVLLGYDVRGRCPMLVDDACSIYEHRPRTCRTYDCRVFAAAGVAVDDGDARKEPIARRVRRWRFRYAGPADRARHDAVLAAAKHLGDHADSLGDDRVPGGVTQLAVVAVEIHEVFLGTDPATGRATSLDPDPVAVRVALRRRNDPPTSS